MRDREKVFGPSAREAYLWCLHCERAYPYDQYREDGTGLELCPYPGCDGDTVMDGWPWSKLLDDHDHYPETPEWGVTYPLYCDRPQCEDRSFLFAVEIKESLSLRAALDRGKTGPGEITLLRSYAHVEHWEWRGRGYEADLTPEQAFAIVAEWSFFGCDRVKLGRRWYDSA